MAIADVMTVEVVAVSPGDTVTEAIRQMVVRNIGAVVVCEGSELVGIFTERDVLHLAVEPGFESRRVGDVMTKRPLAVQPDDDILAVAGLMRDRRIRHVPVVEDGRVLGIASARDLMAALVERLWSSHDEQAHATARALLQR